jgi:hypothetical protein
MTVIATGNISGRGMPFILSRTSTEKSPWSTGTRGGFGYGETDEESATAGGSERLAQPEWEHAAQLVFEPERKGRIGSSACAQVW